MASRSEPEPSPAELGAAPSTLESNLCWLLSQASYSLTTRLTDGLAQIGFSPREHLVLTTAAAGSYTQTDLARMVGLDKTTMVVTLDQLEAAGLAERRPSPTDRRVRVITVTDGGRRKLREADEIMERIRMETLSVLPERQRATFLDALTVLVKVRHGAQPAVGSQSVHRRVRRG